MREDEDDVETAADEQRATEPQRERPLEEWQAQARMKHTPLRTDIPPAGAVIAMAWWPSTWRLAGPLVVTESDPAQRKFSVWMLDAPETERICFWRLDPEDKPYRWAYLEEITAEEEFLMFTGALLHGTRRAGVITGARLPAEPDARFIEAISRDLQEHAPSPSGPTGLD